MFPKNRKFHYLFHGIYFNQNIKTKKNMAIKIHSQINNWSTRLCVSESSNR